MKDFERKFLEAKTEKDRNAIFDDFVADIDRVLNETRSIMAGKGIAADSDCAAESARPGLRKGELRPEEEK